MAGSTDTDTDTDTDTNTDTNTDSLQRIANSLEGIETSLDNIFEKLEKLDSLDNLESINEHIENMESKSSDLTEVIYSISDTLRQISFQEKRQ